METYSFEHNQLTVIDSELNLNFQEAYKPVIIPANPKDGQLIDNQYLVRISINNDGIQDQIYIERNGLLDGQFLLVYPDKKTKMELFYSEGKLHGPAIFYDQDGLVLSQSWFINGKRQGKDKQYYSTGELYSLQRYRDDLWHGKQEFYYPDGTLKTEMHYSLGLLDGVTRLYDANGALEREVVFSEGKQIQQK